METIPIAPPMTLQIRDGVGFLPIAAARTAVVMEAVEAAIKAIKTPDCSSGVNFISFHFSSIQQPLLHVLLGVLLRPSLLLSFFHLGPRIH